MRVVVFGSLNLDTSFDVDHRPAWGETILASAASIAPGGKGANQAVAAARSGRVPVVMVGRVGADAAGPYLREQLAAAGVADAVRVDPALPSGTAFILRSAEGSNAIVVAAGANAGVRIDDLDELRPVDEPAVLVMQLEIPVHAVIAAAGLGRERGWHVLLNTAPAQALPDALLGTIDTLVANEVEAAQLTGLAVDGVEGATAAAEAIRSMGPGRVAVTLGAVGAVLVTPDGAWHAPAPAVRVVDTTASGDAFVGCLAASLAEGCHDRVAIARSVAAGSLAATLPGAQPSLPDRPAIDILASQVDVRGVALDADVAPGGSAR